VLKFISPSLSQHIFHSVHGHPYQLQLEGGKGRLSLCLTENHEISCYLIFLIFIFCRDHVQEYGADSSGANLP
jgi:hypothetical protein